MGGLHRQWLEEVPNLTSVARACPREFPFLLESSGESPHGRVSILMFCNGEAIVAGPGALEGAEFFPALRNWYDREQSPYLPQDSDIPFRGGWFIYLGYEMASAIESVLELPASPLQLPDALACRCPGAVITFRNQGQVRAVAIAEDAATLETVIARVEGARDNQGASPDTAIRTTEVTESDAERFTAGVRRIHEYLLAGDVFQVNLSRSWHARLAEDSDPVDVYLALRRANPAPFSGIMRWEDQAVLSSSPERLIEVRDGLAQTRPIAGTRPRGADLAGDQALSRELINNVKERAEHIMLIDLERNDLGRVCVPGSVEVSELMAIESYAHVHHIVSCVRGRLREDAGPVDAIAAVFPGGTITGCPKVRCMEIIAELEQEGRGFYTGSMGYLNRDGDLDLNILIRSMGQQGREITFRTGAGIVADSIPEFELEETRAKARGLLLALNNGLKG